MRSVAPILWTYTIEFTGLYERVLDALMPKVWQGMLKA